ncbi:protein BONZAI 3-like isoform X2 [Typha latifolia]|uniref:protein BONZAI 3-like isoform X2 n=1 Tax=Typha latifolia TaxID=4733 RepID=UPI003C2ABB0C
MGGCCSDVRGGMEAVGVGPRGGPAGPSAAAAQTEVSQAVDYFFQSRGLRGLYMPLELSLSASKLRNMDILSKSDPMAVLYVKKQDGSLEELSRTEVILNTLNPAWITKFTINYQFEIVQTLVFQIYDIDTSYHNIPVKMLKLNQQDYIGGASCALSQIVTRQDRSLTLNIQSGPSGMHLGTITVHAEESVASRIAVEMTFRCLNLQNKDILSKSDPFLRISRIVETGVSIPVCQTEVINNNLNPLWKPVTVTAQQFVSKENPLMIECFDFNANGNHKLLGKYQGSVMALEKLNRDKSGANFYVQSSIHHDHKKMLKGQLFVDNYSEKIQYSFLDYISNGFELNFMVAIDFTASNGDPRMPQSLHYIDPSGRLNSYQQAIVGVGEILQFYDSDSRFPAWGFGGRTADGSVSHCFNLNQMPSDSEVAGIEGIMSAYSVALRSVSLSGPTIFGPVINKAAEVATRSLSFSQSKYFVLLIITDGVITDAEETKNAIIKASDLPLSILIVGVGTADFKEMEILDADNGKQLQSSTGRIATRDIVQFVPMREFQGNQVSIAQSLLEELPVQFLTYMRSRGIEPKLAQHTDTSWQANSSQDIRLS